MEVDIENLNIVINAILECGKALHQEGMSRRYDVEIVDRLCNSFNKASKKIVDSFTELQERAIAAESKLADLEKQEPCAWTWWGYGDQYFTTDGVKAADIGQEVDMHPLYYDAKPAEVVQDAKPKESVGQRITEQDAREILQRILDEGFTVDIYTEIKTLLAKLNENREPVGHDLGNLWHLKQNEYALVESKNLRVLHTAVFNLFEDIRCLKETNSDPKVTPNKAEVPNWRTIESIPVDRYVDVWLYVPGSQGGRRIADVCKSSAHSSGWVAVDGNNPKYFTHWIYPPLPPLKDVEKCALK